MNRFSRYIAFISCGLLSLAHAAPPVIDDQEILRSLTTQAGEMVGKEGVPSADELSKTTKQGPRLKPALTGALVTASPGKDYATLSKSVFLVASVYNCGKCHNWHKGVSATAWCLSPDGLMVTNTHVFKKATGAAMAVVDREGHCYPVTALLGYDVATDVAVFRVKAENLQALPLGADAEVGSPLSVISNPEGRCFTRTEGSVSRYAKRLTSKDQPKTVWMSITADYAAGSSGGPVFNAEGAVVGMVSSTHSIYSAPNPAKAKDSPKDSPKDLPKGELQMVVHDCVPVSAIRDLIGTETPRTEN